MTVLNWGKHRTALLLGGSVVNNNSGNYPTYFMIGSGSGTIASTDTTLFNPTDRQNTTSATFTNQAVMWTGDWTSIEMSGLSFAEFGMVPSGTGVTGSMWSKSSIPAIVFDGNTELRIEETWQIY